MVEQLSQEDGPGAVVKDDKTDPSLDDRKDRAEAIWDNLVRNQLIVNIEDRDQFGPSSESKASGYLVGVGVKEHFLARAGSGRTCAQRTFAPDSRRQQDSASGKARRTNYGNAGDSDGRYGAGRHARQDPAALPPGAR